MMWITPHQPARWKRRRDLPTGDDHPQSSAPPARSRAANRTRRRGRSSSCARARRIVCMSYRLERTVPMITRAAMSVRDNGCVGCSDQLSDSKALTSKRLSPSHPQTTSSRMFVGRPEIFALTESPRLANDNSCTPQSRRSCKYSRSSLKSLRSTQPSPMPLTSRSQHAATSGSDGTFARASVSSD